MTDNLSSLVEHILPGGLSFIIFIIGFWISVGKHIVQQGHAAGQSQFLSCQFVICVIDMICPFFSPTCVRGLLVEPSH